MNSFLIISGITVIFQDIFKIFLLKILFCLRYSSLILFLATREWEIHCPIQFDINVKKSKFKSGIFKIKAVVSSIIKRFRFSQIGFCKK